MSEYDPRPTEPIGSDGSSRIDVRLSMTSATLEGVKLLIVTPVDGEWDKAMCSYNHLQAVASLMSWSANVGLLPPTRLAYPSDLVRSRSKAVRVARDAGMSHILWLDNDNIPAPGFLGRMLELNHDWIGCPYPRKKIYWDRLKHVMPEEMPEWHAYDYAYQRSSEPGLPVQSGCMAVDRIAIGCTLTSVRALSAMWDHFLEDDWYTDVEVGGVHHETCALFGLLFGETRTVRGKRFRPLFSEDYSACERYNVMRAAHPEMGFGPIQMLVSHPADHVGMHLFKGSAEGIVYAR